jgi:hypothetical protein
MPDQIANAANTLIPAYLALQSKGYRVWWERDGSTPDDETWFAEGPLGSFIADDTLQLLGLVTMREIRGESWYASDDQIDEFMAKYDV